MTVGTNGTGGAAREQAKPACGCAHTGCCATVTPIADVLKARTADLHKQAESHAIQRAMVQGRMTREGFVAVQQQMLRIHDALERALTALRGSEARFGAVVRDCHFRADLLRRDLAALGAAGGSGPDLPPVREFAQRVAEWAAARSVALLGCLYVLEGSTNGSKYIARAMSRAPGFEGGRGLSALDPHGEAQAARWAEFKSLLNSVALTDAEREDVVRGAELVFLTISRVMDLLPAPADHGAAGVPAGGHAPVVTGAR